MPEVANDSCLPDFLEKKPKTGKTPFYTWGLYFSCIRCSACCRYESGYVFLSEADLSVLLAFFNKGRKDFIYSYCRWIPAAETNSNGREQLSLKEKQNFDCIFWDQGCTVYNSRPLQCRAFPFWQWILKSEKNWKQMASECPGIGKGTLHTAESIENWLSLRQKEPIIERDSKSVL